MKHLLALLLLAACCGLVLPVDPAPVLGLGASSSGGSVNLTAPGPIGGTTPSTGAFTTVSANTTGAASMTTTGGYTSTVATGTAPFTATSTTLCPNLNAATLGGATFAAPGAIGGTTPSTGAFTTASTNSTSAAAFTTTGGFTSTVATGTAPITVTSTTVCTNLNAGKLGGATFAAPGAIGGTTPGTGAFTTVSANTTGAASMTTTGGYTSTVATGTAPITVTSTTACPNLNASQLLGGTWASPGATIGSVSPVNITGLFITAGAGAGSFGIGINNGANVACRYTCQNVNAQRWDWGMDTAQVFDVSAYNSSSVLIDKPISIVNAAGGTMTLVRPVTISGAASDLVLATAGQRMRIKEGTNASMGRSTLVAGTVTVSNTLASTTAEIFLTVQTAGGTLGNLSIGTRVAGTSFIINSSNAADTSVVAWHLIEPSP